jgi:hypothetical protein
MWLLISPTHAQDPLEPGLAAGSSLASRWRLSPSRRASSLRPLAENRRSRRHAHPHEPTEPLERGYEPRPSGRAADHRSSRGVPRDRRAIHPPTCRPAAHLLRQARQVRAPAALLTRRLHRGGPRAQRVTGGALDVPLTSAGVAAVGGRLPLAARFAGRRKMGVKWGAALPPASFVTRSSALDWTFEPTRGLEPLTARLQVGCATNCATSAGHENKSRDKDRDHARDDSHHGEGWSRQTAASVSGGGSVQKSRPRRHTGEADRPHMTTLATWLTGRPGSLAATLTYAVRSPASPAGRLSGRPPFSRWTAWRTTGRNPGSRSPR